MQEQQLELKSLEHIRLIGKILGNRNKVLMLMELSKTPLPKSKIASILGITKGTVSGYVSECVTAGLVQEDPILDRRGNYFKIVSLKVPGIFMVFGKTEKDLELT